MSPDRTGPPWWWFTQDNSLSPSLPLSERCLTVWVWQVNKARPDLQLPGQAGLSRTVEGGRDCDELAGARRATRNIWGEERRVGGEEFIGGIGRYWHPQREYSASRHQGFTFIESSPGNWWQLATNDKHHEKLKLLSKLKLTFTSLTCWNRPSYSGSESELVNWIPFISSWA